MSNSQPDELARWQWLNCLRDDPPTDPRWKPTTMAVAMGLYAYVGKAGVAYPGDEKLARLIGTTARTVGDHRRILLDLGLIQCTSLATSRGHAGVYRLAHPDQWRTHPERVKRQQGAEDADPDLNLGEPPWLNEVEDEGTRETKGPAICGASSQPGLWCDEPAGHLGHHFRNPMPR